MLMSHDDQGHEDAGQDEDGHVNGYDSKVSTTGSKPDTRHGTHMA